MKNCLAKIMYWKIKMTEQKAKCEYEKLVAENHDLKTLNESLKINTEEKEVKISRLKQQTFNVENEKEELQEEILRQKKIIDKLESDLCIQLSENAKLSGHRNHLQKIAYVDNSKTR